MQQQDTQSQTQEHSQEHSQKENKHPQKRMPTQAITIYCLCDDFLRIHRWRDDPQARMNTAEVMTVSLGAAALFDGNQGKSRRSRQEHGYIKTMLSKSRFNRLWHALPEVLWQGLLCPMLLPPALPGEAASQTRKASLP